MVFWNNNRTRNHDDPMKASPPKNEFKKSQDMQRPDAVLFEPGLLAVLGKRGGTKRGKACHFNPGFRVSRFEFSLSTLLVRV